MNLRTVIASLLIAASLLLVTQAQAGAADKQSFLLSGQAGLNYYLKSGGPQDSPTSGLDLTIAPRLLYFPVKSIGVGGEANFYTYANGSKQTNIAIGPRAAFFLKPDASHYPRACCLTPWFGGNSSYWMPFVGVSLMYLMNSSTYSGYSSTASGFLGRVGVGAAPLIGDHGTAFVELGYQMQSLTQSGGSFASAQTSGKIYLEAGFGVFLFK
ncbi:hypothetical protein FJY68_06260 [candidate division WOR-3 bacterium]|uniref:Outer membrane protein beta-barrel domain-containing protein n=1 Tax=candidate division WOR-3 bacterium TaxID=2052148 RepID=A0A937XE13_UNCW3|nr:hypothetical protein [candidate division WOR-3 bacterium]